MQYKIFYFFISLCCLTLASCLKPSSHNPASSFAQVDQLPGSPDADGSKNQQSKLSPCTFDPSDFSFTREVLPILQDNCTSCHGPTQAIAGLRLDSYSTAQNMLAPLDRWTAVAARISNRSMPPLTMPALSDCQISLIQSWVKAGAPEQSGMLPHDPREDELLQLVKPLQRLSRIEMENVLRDLLGTEIFGIVQSKVANIPEDDKSGGFDNFNWSLSPAHISAYFDIATAAASAIAQHPDYLASFAVCLNEASLSASCVKDFIEKFGLLSYRRPLTAEELTDYTALYLDYASTDPRRGLELVLATFLQSPPFIYHLETEGVALSPGSSILRLSSFELASRLSFMLLQSSPDSELLAAAASEQLLDPRVLAQQVDRLLKDPRAAKMVQSFFDQWLRIDSLPNLQVSDALKGDIDTTNLKVDAIAELHSFIRSIIWDQQGTFADLLLSRFASIPSLPLARVYGLDLSPNLLNQPVELPQFQRRGLLTRAALLLAGQDEPSPIHRGALLRTQFICDSLPTPDPKSLPPGSLEPPSFDPQLSNRKRWEKKTQSEVCQSCHVKINPLGFSMGNYDSLGRYVETSAVFGPQGEVLNIFPVDASAVPAISYAESDSVNGLVQLSELLAQHPKTSACFVKQWFRYVFHRQETEFDRDIFSSLHAEAQKSGSGIKGMIIKTLLLPENRQRKLVP